MNETLLGALFIVTGYGSWIKMKEICKCTIFYRTDTFYTVK